MDKPYRNDEPKKYIVVESLDGLSDLENGVNYRIAEGYQPVGGVSVITVVRRAATQLMYHQAMVRNA